MQEQNIPNYNLPINLTYQPKILLVGSMIFGALGIGVLYLFFTIEKTDYTLLGSSIFFILLTLFSLYIYFKPTRVIIDEKGIHIVRMKSQTILWNEIAAISNFGSMVTYQPSSISCKKEVVGGYALPLDKTAFRENLKMLQELHQFYKGDGLN